MEYNSENFKKGFLEQTEFINLNRLADEIGLSSNTLYALKNHNIKMIKFDTLNKICKALKCTPNDLFK